MDGKLWDTIYQTVMTIDHPNPRLRVTHSDRAVVLVLLRAGGDGLSVSRCCRPEAWAGLARPKELPSQPTMSRRAKTPQVQGLLRAVEDWLRRHGPPDEKVIAVDGRPLSISPHSKDPDAAWGWAIGGFGFGYKLQAIWGTGPVPLAWAVRPLSIAESVLAAGMLVPQLPQATGRRYLVGDASYETNRMHAAAAQRGYQLLAPPKHQGEGVGHRPHHPARLRGLEMLRTPYGQRLYKRRGLIERQFGNATMRPEGLGELPAHVRRLARVRTYVHAKIILNGFRILMNRNLLTPLAA